MARNRGFQGLHDPAAAEITVYLPQPLRSGRSDAEFSARVVDWRHGDDAQGGMQDWALLEVLAPMYDGKEWNGSRSSPTDKQIAAGLTMLPRADVDALVASLRAARRVRLVPTLAPGSRAALLTILEFDSEASARRWVRLSGLVSAHENETRKEGALRFTNAKETRLDGASVRGLLQEKTMAQGELKFDLVTIDAHRGPFVVATSLVGDPPSTTAHLKLVEDVFAGLGIAK